MKKRDQKLRQKAYKRKPRFVDQGKSVVIDFYPQGKSLSIRRSGDYNPLVVVITVNWFQFFDVILSKDSEFFVCDNILLSPKNKSIIRLTQLHFDQLSNSALNILPKVITNIITTFEARFVKFLNQAHPLTTRMHQLQLLPGIGQKRMWAILEARKRRFFTSFNDFTERTGISDPMSLFSNRILIELESSPKYHLFTKKDTKA